MAVSAFSDKIKREADDYDRVRVKWAEFLIGVSSGDDLSSPDVKEIIAANDRNAKRSYKKLKEREVKKTTSGAEILDLYNGIKNTAKGYATPGSEFYKNSEVKESLIKELDWLYENAYHEGIPELGNWWQWEIGIPKAINDILAMMYEDVPVEKREKYLKATMFFQPDPRYNGAGETASYSSTPEKRISTGGNRTDTSMISFMRGILLKDKKEVVDAVITVTDVGNYAVRGDGFYRDGSFVQHDNVSYNGTYASVLFNGLGGILYLAKDTEFEVESEKLDNVYDAILKGYTYLFINGGINDSVSGRAISRDNSSDLNRGRDIVNSMAMLSEGTPDEYRVKIQELIKTTIVSNTAYDVVAKAGNRTIKNILKKIMQDENIKVNKTIGSKMFHAMDRAVMKNNRGGAVLVSMHSSRIANFETINGENLKGWFTGDGMTYIYGNDSTTFTEFWPTVDMYHLPGVTNSLKERGLRSGERRGIPTPKAWTGGAEGNGEVFAGMDMLSWNKAIEVKKSYLFTEDGAVLVMASNLNGHEGETHTTIDNRILKDGKVYVNGKEIKETTVIDNPENLIINFTGNYPEENIGYRIIDAPQVVIRFEKRNGNWKSIGGTDKKEIEKNYVTIYINHGKNPKNDKFAYMILPMFTSEEVTEYNSGLEIIRADKTLHAVKDNKRVRINFWKDIPVEYEGIKSFSTASVIMERKGNELLLSLCEPTQLAKADSIFELEGMYSLEESSTEKIEVTIKNNRTRIKIDLRNNGATENLKLKKIKF